MNNTRVFRFLSIALLAAIALYFAAQGYFALTDPFTTTLVYQSSAEDTIDAAADRQFFSTAFFREAAVASTSKTAHLSSFLFHFCLYFVFCATFQ